MGFGGVYYVQSSSLHRLVFIVASFFSLVVVISIWNCDLFQLEFCHICWWDLDSTPCFVAGQTPEWQKESQGYKNNWVYYNLSKKILSLFYLPYEMVHTSNICTSKGDKGMSTENQPGRVEMRIFKCHILSAE